MSSERRHPAAIERLRLNVVIWLRGGALALGALGVVLATLEWASRSTEFVGHPAQWRYVYMTASVILAVHGMAALALWFGARPLARRMAPAPSREPACPACGYALSGEMSACPECGYVC